MKTPVDSGRARGNWQVSIGKDTSEQLDRCSKNGENIIEESSKLESVQGDQTIYISNNLPYIATLEYGGYPDPVKKGSWDKRKKKYVIKSRGGFSKQAPHGMVGVTMANIQKYISNAFKKK